MNKETSFDLCLRIADNNLILGQRISEWCGHGPYLEEDIAMSNIGLDILGQARYFFQYLCELKPDNKTEDDYAFLRSEKEYKNDLIVELPNGDYAQSILRIYFVSLFNKFLYQNLSESSDETLAAMSSKAIKETEYHILHTQSWVIRFGLGTSESIERLQKAFEYLYPYTEDMFSELKIEQKEKKLKKTEPLLLCEIQKIWIKEVKKVFSDLEVNTSFDTYQHKGRLESLHTEHIGHLISEMQYMQRTYPNCKW